MSAYLIGVPEHYNPAENGVVDYSNYTQNRQTEEFYRQHYDTTPYSASAVSMVESTNTR